MENVQTKTWIIQSYSTRISTYTAYGKEQFIKIHSPQLYWGRGRHHRDHGLKTKTTCRAKYQQLVRVQKICSFETDSLKNVSCRSSSTDPVEGGIVSFKGCHYRHVAINPHCLDPPPNTQVHDDVIMLIMSFVSKKLFQRLFEEPPASPELGFKFTLLNTDTSR